MLQNTIAHCQQNHWWQRANASKEGALCVDSEPLAPLRGAHIR
jgi:hypothetical protein